MVAWSVKLSGVECGGGLWLCEADKLHHVHV